jgi:hypothetical protein
MKIVLDINIFNNKKFCEWLLKSPEKKYLPAFAYLEYLYHNLKKVMPNLWLICFRNK